MLLLIYAILGLAFFYLPAPKASKDGVKPAAARRDETGARARPLDKESYATFS